ncbi:MAG: glycosyltransferase family 1 protein, partial [Hydrogenobaculum sp.]
MKAIKLNTSEIEYKEETIKIPNKPFLVPDTLAKVIFEAYDTKLYSIRKHHLRNLNISFSLKKPKNVLVMLDLDAFSSFCIVPILKTIEKTSSLKVFAFSNKYIFEFFGIELLKEVPSLETIAEYDGFYTLFQEDLSSFDFDTSNRIHYFEHFFDIKAENLEPFIRNSGKDVTFINSEHFYKAKINNTSNIDNTITIPKDIFSKSTIKNITNALKNSKTVVTTHPAVAYLCHINKVPCVFIVGGFDGKVFGEKSSVKLLRIPYVGTLCSSPCMRITDDVCIEAKTKGLSINPCLQIEYINDSYIEDAVKKANTEPYTEGICKFCNSKTKLSVVDIEKSKEYKECNVCKSVFSDKEECYIDKDIAMWGIKGFFSFYENPLAMSILGKLHNIDIAYLLKASNLKGKVLVYKACNGEVSHILKHIGYDVVSVEDDANLKQIGFVLFGIKYDERPLESILKEIDIVIIPDITLLKDLNVLEAFKEKHILIGAPNKESLINTLGRYQEPIKSYVTSNALVKLLSDVGKNAFIYTSRDLSYPKEYFGEFLSKVLNLGNNIFISLFEHENFYKLKAQYGTYIYASSFPIEKEIYRAIDFSKWNTYEKSVFTFHKTSLSTHDEPYVEIYSEGPKGKVLITDHWELISNYPELFASKGYTVGIVRKDVPMNLSKLKSEVKEFSPDFAFFGFYGDLLFMRDENGWDMKPKDFWFREFNFPIVSLKVDFPNVNRYSLTKEGLEILKKYKDKFAIIHHDKFLAECFRTFGIKAYWWTSNGFIMSNLNLSTDDFDMPDEEKLFDIVFPGNMHQPNEETYHKYKNYIECYKNDVSDIRKCVNIPCIKDGFFNEEFFNISSSVISYVRALYPRILKEKYKDKMLTTDVINIPYSRLKYVLSASKITFYIHSQGFSTIHDMIFEAPLFGSLPIVDKKEEAEILFPNHYKEITYTNIEDAIKKIDYYLSHEDERELLIKELKDIILTYYKQDFRIDMIEYALRELK